MKNQQNLETNHIVKFWYKNTWTSICLGLVMYFSSKIVSMPKEAAASRFAPRRASTKSLGLCTILIPCMRTVSYN